MKLNKWTWALAATGAVSLGSVVLADEHPVNTMLSSTTLYGYVDTSAIWNFGRGTAVAPRFLNTGMDRQDGFNLNAAKIGIEKPLDEGTWAAGYKVETIIGPDAAYFNSAELGKSGIGTVAFKQAYVALRAPVGNGIDFKVGVWDPIIGYEVFDSYANPNFARSFGYYLEPFQHTGILATYQFTEIFSVAAGVGNAGNTLTASNGSSVSESRKSYMGAFTLKAPDSAGWLHGSSLYAGIVDTAQTAVSGRDTLNLYAGATMATPITGFTLGAAYDYKEVHGGSTGHAHAIAVYGSYAFNDQLKLNVRPEWAKFGGHDIWAVTGTVDYQLWANVVSRVEVRWDHAEKGDISDLSGYAAKFGYLRYHYDSYDYGYTTAEPTSGSGSGSGSGSNVTKNDLSLLVNLIYKF